MSELPISGGCACGGVRYEITGEFGFSFLCQCRRCQRATGSGHAPAFKVDNQDFVLKGEIKSYEVEADSGYKVRSQFCGICGSPLFSSTDQFPDSTAILAATLDDPTLFTPQHVIFRDAAQPWDHTDPTIGK